MSAQHGSEIPVQPPAPPVQPPVGAELRATLRRGVVVLLGMLALIGVGILAISSTDIGRETIAQIWTRAQPLGLVASIVLISLSQPAVAMRWRALLPATDKGRPHPVPLMAAMCVGLVFNYALPGPVGEVTSSMMVRRRYGIPLAEALAALAVSRVIGLGSACALAGLLYLAFPLELPTASQGLIGAAAWGLLIGSMGLAAVALFPRQLHAVFDAMIGPFERLPGRLGTLFARAHVGIGHLFDALAGTLTRGVYAYAAALFWAMCGHMAVATGITAAAWSLGVHPPWTGVIFTYAAATAGALALFLFPGSHVGWDVSFGAILAVSTGVSAADATAVTVVARVQQTVVLLVGVLALVFFAKDLLPERKE